MSPIISCADVSVTYGAIGAVRNVSVDVYPGQVTSVIGPNGAGKSSLLMALVGLVPATGVVRVHGQVVTNGSPERMLALGVAFVPERRELFAELSVLDNLELGAFSRRRGPAGAIKADLEAVFARFPRLRERSGQLAHTLSGGERQMLALGRALMARPKVLILDEPSLGLAPLVVREILQIVKSLREAGTAVLLVEQNARGALAVSDRGYVLERGEIVLAGDAASLASNPRVAASYLGGSRDHRREFVEAAC